MAGNLEALFLESLPLIDKITAILARRHALAASEAEEFTAWARARLIEGDYAVFRKFAGRSALGTYLTVVLAHLFQDYRNSRWGRWRPSAAARRLGPVAQRLETLLYRDGLPARQAIEVLKSRGLAEPTVRALMRQLPPRFAAREVPLDASMDGVAGGEAADRELRTEETDRESAATERAVGEALATLQPEDQLLVRMRFWEDCSIAVIARTLGLEQKPLYRRLAGIQSALAVALEGRGIGRDQVATFLARDDQAPDPSLKLQ